jgi:short-subunit dehydrogenase
MSLRAETAGLGVKVSVVCPGFVQTGMLDALTYVGVKREAAIAELSGIKMVDAARCALTMLRGVERSRAIIIDSALTGLLWRLNRLSPSILGLFLQQGVKDMRVLRVAS